MPERIRITVHYKRKPGVSDKEFDNYWLNEFPKAFSSLKVVQGKNIKYDHGEAHDEMHDHLAQARIGKVCDHDASAIIEGDSMFDLRDVFTSEEYRTVIGGRAVKYFEPGSMSLFASTVSSGVTHKA